MHHFYVYQYFDPIRQEPIYIGKGHGQRAYKHLKRIRENNPFTARIKWMRKQGVEPVVTILKTGLEDGEALVLESLYIRKFGRKDLGEGPLLNLTDGMEGFGRRYSVEQKKMRNDRMREKWKEPGYKERLAVACSVGLKKAYESPALREKQRKNSSAMWNDPEVRAKLMAARKRQGEAKKGVERDVKRKSYVVTFPDGREETVYGMKPWCKRNRHDARSMFRLVKGDIEIDKGMTARLLNPA